jgi:beta-xylosidase
MGHGARSDGGAGGRMEGVRQPIGLKRGLVLGVGLWLAAVVSPLGGQNPVMRGADPHAVVIRDTVWLYATERSGEGLFFAHSSTDLVHWEQHGPVLRFAEIDWIPAGKHAWAPALEAKDGRYYFYYSVGPKPSHIGVAVGDSPAGPFIDSGRALLSDHNDPGFEAIDPVVFTDPASGRSYFYAGGSSGSTLRVFEMAEDMVSFAREIEVETPPFFTEGPFVHYDDGIYHFTYSHGAWRRSSYSVHHATAPTPTGPWTYRGAILTSDDRHKGPGHHSVIQNPRTGEWLIVYHRWNDREGDGPYTGSREVAIDRLVHEPGGVIRPVTMTDEGVTDWKRD